MTMKVVERLEPRLPEYLARDECNSNIEQVLKGCNSMADIRKRAESNPTLKEEWLKSLTTIINTIETERLSLKGVPFKCHKPASDALVQAIEHQMRYDIDQNIVPWKYQQKDLSSTKGIYRYMLHDTSIKIPLIIIDNKYIFILIN